MFGHLKLFFLIALAGFCVAQTDPCDEEQEDCDQTDFSREQTDGDDDDPVESDMNDMMMDQSSSSGNLGGADTKQSSGKDKEINLKNKGNTAERVNRQSSKIGKIKAKQKNSNGKLRNKKPRKSQAPKKPKNP